jgi:methylphosphotriester-DNA--protein-cysteine methyltransferase
MAVQEWQMVSDAVQAIKPTAGNLDEQMRDVVRQARTLAKNMQDKFDLTYEETQNAAAPKPARGGALSPAEEAELAQLRKRFGK